MFVDLIILKMWHSLSLKKFSIGLSTNENWNHVNWFGSSVPTLNTSLSTGEI